MTNKILTFPDRRKLTVEMALQDWENAQRDCVHLAAREGVPSEFIMQACERRREAHKIYQRIFRESLIQMSY